MPRLFVVGFALAILAGVLALPTPSAHAAEAGLDRTERQVIVLLNQERSKHGLRPLRASRPLARAADHHTRDMIRRDFFAHDSSDGTSFGTRLDRYTRAGRVGENIGYVAAGNAALRNVAPQIVRMWMGSAGHRAMILTGSFRRVGIGGRSGRLGGDRVTVFTADFASR